MLEFFRKLFNSDFMPHGMCFLWNPPVLWLNVISDALIALAYYAIPFLLFDFARKRRDLTFKWIFVAFGAFILACGSTHLLGAVTVWNPMYRFEGVVKAITAIASVATFFMLIPLLPMLVKLPSPSELARVNRSLAAEIQDRKAAEEEVRRINEGLEERVAERTAELAQSASLFRQLADAMPQLVWITSPDGAVEYFNGQWYRYTGSRPQDVLGREWVSVLHPEDRDRTLGRWAESVRTGAAYEIEYRLRAADGSYHWFLGRGNPAFDSNGRIVKWFGTCTDIDEQKRSAESLGRALADLRQEMKRRQQLEDQLLQSQKMEAVGRLAGGVAHDFNNLLTAILGYHELLQEEIQDRPAAKDYAAEILHAAERASALTNQLLAFSRRQVAQPRVVDMNELVTQMERMLRRIIGEDIELETHLAPDLARVNVDPANIDQVILNLAVNARDAMPQGGKLTIETGNADLTEEYAGQHIGVSPGKYVMLAVSDTGKGMSAETCAHLFEPFFTTKEKGKGTGLGLSIVYGIVKQNGGEILVYSEPDHGAVFKIYLPAVETGGEPLRAPASDVSERGTGTILLVEDEDQVRSLTRTILSRRGYRILEAASGAEALRIVREQGRDIDLLLTDMIMPQMGGRELADAVAAEQPRIKVLFMSGYTDAAVLRHGILDAGKPYIQKPFTAAALTGKVREVFDSSRGPGEDRPGNGGGPA